ITPFALGAAIGAIATDRVPVGNAAGDLWSSWLNPTSIFIGVLAVATSAYLAAVYLAADAARDRHRELESGFRVRALGAGVAAGVWGGAPAPARSSAAAATTAGLSLGGGGGGLPPAVSAPAVPGAAPIVPAPSRRYEPARYSAALAVGAIVAGWALARWPTILPGLTVYQAAAGHDTLVCVVVAVLGGVVILLPALALLFRLTLAGRFRADAFDAPE